MADDNGRNGGISAIGPIRVTPRSAGVPDFVRPGATRPSIPRVGAPRNAIPNRLSPPRRVKATR